jgi:hypothetical protein
MKRLALVALLAALLAGCRAGPTFDPDPVFSVGPISDTTSHQITKLDHVASMLAGRQTIVNCWSEHDWEQLQAWRGIRHYPIDPWGITYPATRRIQLAPFVCQILAQTLAKSANQPLFTAAAVTTLAHESAHARGIEAENLAECRAIKTDPRAARLLGLPAAAATRLPHIYRGSIYPYDLARYRTPPCPAGLPGVVVPDTLGSAADLRPLERTATAVGRSLGGWTNLEGGGSVGPLSPCSPIVSRTVERARYTEWFKRSKHESAFVGTVRFDTRRSFATAVERERNFERCDIALDNRLSQESHSFEPRHIGRIPDQFLRLSPEVHAFRMTSHINGFRMNDDRITILDAADLRQINLDFNVPAGTPIGQELRAVKAALRSLR